MFSPRQEWIYIILSYICGSAAAIDCHSSSYVETATIDNSAELATVWRMPIPVWKKYLTGNDDALYTSSADKLVTFACEWNRHLLWYRLPYWNQVACLDSLYNSFQL